LTGLHYICILICPENVKVFFIIYSDINYLLHTSHSASFRKSNSIRSTSTTQNQLQRKIAEFFSLYSEWKI